MLIYYYYLFKGYYGEDKLDDEKIGIQSLIGCPKTNMETKCQGRVPSENQYVLIVQYFMVVLVFVEVLVYYSSFKGYYGKDKLDDGKIGI